MLAVRGVYDGAKVEINEYVPYKEKQNVFVFFPDGNDDEENDGDEESLLFGLTKKDIEEARKERAEIFERIQKEDISEEAKKVDVVALIREMREL
jgi:hypothetical protein